jgi:hypothetical protein
MALLGSVSKMKVDDIVFERVATVGVENLTEVEKYYWLLWLVEAEATNGGLEAFLENSFEYARETIKALKAVKAQKMADILGKAVDLYESSTKNLDSNEMRDFSNAFTDYPDNFRKLVENYINENRDRLLGPKNELELWESRKARNANTPRFVTKDIDYEKEALDDAQYSSRKCPECNQPVPDYRKTCKKCGYPLGKFIKP